MSKLNAFLPSGHICSGSDCFLLPGAEVALPTALVPTLLVPEAGPSGYSWANQLLYSHDVGEFFWGCVIYQSPSSWFPVSLGLMCCLDRDGLDPCAVTQSPVLWPHSQSINPALL